MAARHVSVYREALLSVSRDIKKQHIQRAGSGARAAVKRLERCGRKPQGSQCKAREDEEWRYSLKRRDGQPTPSRC